MVGQSGLSIEEQLYVFMRDDFRRRNLSGCRPLTDDFIIQAVGWFGFDILKKTKFIEESDTPGQYVLCCEG